MGFEGAGYDHYLGQAGLQVSAVAFVERVHPLVGIRLAPKHDHLLVVEPSPEHSQVYLQQFAKAGLMPVRDRALQPEVPGLP